MVDFLFLENLFIKIIRCHYYYLYLCHHLLILKDLEFANLEYREVPDLFMYYFFFCLMILSHPKSSFFKDEDS